MSTKGVKEERLSLCRMTHFFLNDQQKIKRRKINKRKFMDLHTHFLGSFMSFSYSSLIHSSPLFNVQMWNPRHLLIWCKNCTKTVGLTPLKFLLANISKTSPTELHCFCLNPNPRHTKQRMNEKKKREERKISSWLPLTITNSSFPLRRHCEHS